jgi:hypothetical protein
MAQRTKVLDTIFMKYQMKAVDLQRAIDHYDLEKDPDVESIKKTNKQMQANFAEA